MNTHDMIELPQGYAERPFDYSGDLYTEGQVRAIVEAYRKRGGEQDHMKYKGHPHNPDHYRFRRPLPGAVFNEEPTTPSLDDVLCAIVLLALFGALVFAPLWVRYFWS